MFKPVLGWSAAVLTTAVLGSIVQSQINLLAISRIHQAVAFGDRLAVTLFDLRNFAPLWAAVLALGLLIAFLAAGWLARRRPAWRGLLFPAAGFAAVLTALLVMQAMLPVAVVAAARSAGGVLAMSLAGALGGWVYLQVVSQRQKGRN